MPAFGYVRACPGKHAGPPLRSVGGGETDGAFHRLATVPDEGAAQDKLTIAIALVQAGVVVNSMLAVIAR